MPDENVVLHEMDTHDIPVEFVTLTEEGSVRLMTSTIVRRDGTPVIFLRRQGPLGGIVIGGQMTPDEATNFALQLIHAAQSARIIADVRNDKLS